MAKVYSWQVSERAFAYIVDPNDTSIPRIGSEITNEKDIQTISDWAQNATDTQYDAQFEKMVAKCHAMGYNVEFETPVAYRTVATTCDNLRGPAGRGIQKIEYSHPAPNGEGSVYYIYYDDGWSDSIIIKDGKDGRDGVDGKPGAPGDSGVSSKLIMIYTSGVDADGNIRIPERPQGGSYDFIDGVFVCPDGWSRNDGDDGSLTPPIWQSTRTFASTEASTDNRWSTPVQITGESGAPGADGTSTEFIYCLSLNKPNIFGPNGERMESDPDVNGFVPNESWGFTASPQGVDEDNKCEWCCIRTKNKETGKWGEWTDPTIWSKYGENGQDGDGVQYIYLKNNGKIPVNPTPFGYDMHDTTDPDIKEVYTNYQNKDDEWLPPVGSYSNYSNEIATTPCVKDNTNIPENSNIGIWTDDPNDVDNEFQFIWVSSRKYRKSQESGKKMWTKFSDPTLWAKFGESGKNATSIRRLYALTPSTGNPPDLPNDSNFTGDWGTGFPKDYKADENVVWATEAEIWAHNFEFVMSYRRVSLTDTEGNTIPPADANTSNSKEVPYLPDEQNTGYTYLIYDKHYYKWDGGWCEPFLVTGVKGDPGNPLDYTTYVFAFGYTDYPPKPPMSNNPANPGTSAGDNNILVQWVDFPDTSLYRDGIQEGTNIDMRWFQCEGHVNNKGEIKVDDTGKLKWGAVTPCNPRDGEGKTGPYYEFRFGITKDDKEPITVFSNDNVWIRKPEYYINNEQYGWFDTDDKMPAIPAGGAMWQIWALIDPETDTVITVNGKGWNGPRRISGEKGEQGLQGPAGLRGVSGLPGVAQHTMYCLGTYGKNTSEYYFDHYTAGGNYLMGDGYFGSNEYQGKFIDDLTTMGWYAYNEMPYSDIIQVVNDDEFEVAYKNEKNQGRVICYKKTTMDEKSGSSFKVDTYQYFLVGKGGYPIQLTEPLNEKENEKFEVYIWCIQGNDVYKAGKHKLYVELEGIPEDADENNTTTVSTIPEEELEYKPKYLYSTSTNTYYQWKEIPGDEVVHTLERIEWSSPFKLQGTNGLRGLAGNRGQVVYPMGVYNHEEIYITTDTKAPYVYDPNDGLFYVYNIVGQPWIGKLPENYREVMIDKDGDGKAEYYKYSSDGSGRENTWYTIDQDGDTPANNFANAKNQDRTPAWVRFESFQALYTNIGIIANGMIGSAVYNNEFMFSQQGINQRGEKTNYAVVSGKPGDNDSGFLSGYEFSETPNKISLGEGKGYIIQNWKYRDTNTFINDTDVDPYKKNANGEYIHGFMPNVCINFSTGQMWLQCGKLRFGQLDKDTNVYTQEEVDKNVEEELRKQIDAFGNDNYISPEERKSLKETYDGFSSEYTSILNQAETLGLSGTAEYTSYNNFKTYAESALKYYSSTANTITDSESNYYGFIQIVNTGTGTTNTSGYGSGAKFYGNIAEYYKKKDTLQQKITEKLNTKIDDIEIPTIPDTDWLIDQFETGSTEYYGGAVLSNFLGVKNQDGNIAAFLNGSSDSPELKSSDGSSIMMLGVGVNGGIANKITIYPWTCADEVEDGFSTIYTTVDYSNLDNALTIKDGVEIKTYTYSNNEIIECPGFSYFKNPETNSSESSATDNTKTLYRSVNSEDKAKSGYIYSRATSLSNKTENAVKFTPTRIYSDGTVVINNLITSGGEFNGEINAGGQFTGTVSSDKGYLNHYNINRSVIKNSDIVLRHDYEETDTDTYENYNTLTCTDSNNNVLVKMGPAYLETNNQRYTVSVNTINSYHKNHNGNDNGQWYGTNNAWKSMCSFKVNGGETITLPSVSMYIWIWTSGRKVVKYPYYGLRVVFYSGSTVVSSETLQSYTTVAPYKGGGKGGYSYFSKNTTTKKITVPSGVNNVALEYSWKMHLHTYAWLGADKSAGEITITPNSNILVENGQRRNIIEVGGNGLRVMNGSKEKPLFFEIMPNGITMERGDVGIRVSRDPEGDGDSGIFIKLHGEQGYRELYVSDNVLKLYTSITDFK